MKKKYPGNSCTKIILCCDRAQYGEVGYWQRAKMKFHIFFCSACKKYSKKNGKLSETIKKSQLSSLNSNEMRELKEQLKSNPNK